MVRPRVRWRHLAEQSQQNSPVPLPAAPQLPDNGAESDSETSEVEHAMDMADGIHPNAPDNHAMDIVEGGGGEVLPGEVTYDSDLENSNASISSRGSWYNVPTPPPSPPQSPQPDQDDNEPSEDEDGFRNIGAEDYREYERWYAEDNPVELDEMVAETLTDEELDSFIMMAIRQFGHVSQRNYERIRYSYRNKLHLLSLQRVRTRLAVLSGVKPVNIDCCINVCHAFTRQYAEETTCSSCGEPRYDYKHRPRQFFQYLPATPRFQAMFNNPDMITKILYRSQFVQEPGPMVDWLNGRSYLDLCERNIIIDGEDTGVRYFNGKYDIATAILSDGVQIFEEAHQENNTCWPIMAQNLNLPPSERAQLRNLIPLGVIPGPNKPKDFDSFLVLFVEECVELARGVETYNVLTGRTFIFRMHPIIVSGDMQAIKFFQNLKGPKAKVPCRECLLVGIYHAARRTYYIPLAEPFADDGSSETVNSCDPRQLPLRTEKNIITQLGKIERAGTTGAADDLRKKYGICGPSILDEIPSIQRPTSYPHEFMHLFLLNHGPDLVSLWINSYKGISDSGSEDYLISADDWIAIGKETADATNLIPAAFIRPLPNIESNWRLYCAESWSFWLTYIGPIVLRGRLPKKYYDHYLELVSIIKCLLELENTTRRIEELKEEIIHYVEKFEEYYYQYSYDRLCVCKLTLHALLHVPDDVLRCGPVWVSWSFSIERYCREIVGSAKSKVVPYSTINKHVLAMAQLATVACRFPEIRKALLFGKADAPVKTNPDTILRFPCLRGFPLTPHVRRRVARYFCTNIPGRTFHDWLQLIPERCERWGKLRIADGGDCIRCAAVVDPLSPYGKRDSSFVRYTFYKDKNEKYRNLPIEMVSATGYGRLDYILALTLPPDPHFKIKEPTLHILAHITEAKHADGDATTEFISFTEFGRSFVLDVSAVENVVGRVETRGVKESGEWVIVDRSSAHCRTAFHAEEHEFEGEDE